MTDKVQKIIMTQEEKSLLLKDLCARLPYGVLMQVQHCKVECRHHLLGVNTENNTIRIDHCNELNEELFIRNWMPINDCRPYLRSMSTMTAEERYEYIQTCEHVEIEGEDVYFQTWETIDWLNKKGFDYRGLIENGLALEATEGMY